MPDGERAVSEVVGFVVVFAIVVVSVSLVAATGYAGLANSRAAEQATSAEQGLDLLADNVADLADGAPSRSTELRLGGADLYVGDPVTVAVRGHPVGDPGTVTFDEQYQLRPLVYDTGDGSRVVYVAGAVLRSDRGESVMSREPDLLVSGSETVLTLVSLRPVDASGVGGTTTTHVRTTATKRRLTVAEPTPQVVTVEVTTPRAGGWERYLRGVASDDPALSCSRPASETVRCTVTSDRTYVTVVDSDVRFE